MRTRKIASNDASKAAHWYTNEGNIVLSIVDTDRKKMCDMTMNLFHLDELIAAMQLARSRIARKPETESTPIWYRGRNIGTAQRSGSIYTFHASETLDADAQEFARRELEAMNQSWRQIL